MKAHCLWLEKLSEQGLPSPLQWDEMRQEMADQVVFIEQFILRKMKGDMTETDERLIRESINSRHNKLPVFLQPDSSDSIDEENARTRES
jgi:hypothetical protein